MLTADDMRIILRVADLASFTQAAESLGLPKANVSYAVRQAEEYLGVRLFQRTTRRVMLTHDGRVFCERAQDLLSDWEELAGLFRRDGAGGAVSGRLRVDLPAVLARDLIIPRLPDFLERHPDLHLELSATDRRVDLLREGFDCVLRVGELADSSLIVRRLGEYRLVNCASPAYLARQGVPRVPADLLQGHRLVQYVQNFGGRGDGFDYADPDDPSREHSLALPGTLTVNGADSYAAACLAGLGIIQAPWHGLRAHLEAGRLVEILPQYRPAPMPVSLLYPNRRHLPRRVQVFIDWLAGLVMARLQEQGEKPAAPGGSGPGGHVPVR
jgi:DNA-binding transcriptional LysR family regulator